MATPVKVGYHTKYVPFVDPVKTLIYELNHQWNKLGPLEAKYKEIQEIRDNLLTELAYANLELLTIEEQIGAQQDKVNHVAMQLDSARANPAPKPARDIIEDEEGEGELAELTEFAEADTQDDDGNMDLDVLGAFADSYDILRVYTRLRPSTPKRANKKRARTANASPQ